jgi:hypothetical protein
MKNTEWTLTRCIEFSKIQHAKAVKKVNTLKNKHNSIKRLHKLNKDQKFLLYCLLNPNYVSYERGYMILSKKEQVKYNMPALITATTSVLTGSLMIMPIR